jgi:GDP-L-fucose synthase
MRLLITGSNGYIGRNIYHTLKSYNHEIVNINRAVCDLRDSSSVKSFFAKQPFFDCVIHTAAVIVGEKIKADDINILTDNISMFYNLYKYKDRFSKFISLGSGAELLDNNNPYGMSKKIIRNLVLETDNFFNMRIYGMFDHTELARRFMKANILRYIHKHPLVIHKDKYMDFIYMQDFINLLVYYLSNNAPKEIDCVYRQKYKLSDIANLINKLNTYNVDVIINDHEQDQPYCGEANELISYIGLENGIKDTYQNLMELINEYK